MFALPLVPIFIGLILVWISDVPAKNKLFASIIVIPAMAAGFLTFYLIMGKADPEIFLLKSEFRGPFVVVFMEGCETPIPIENGARIYNIPATGVLLHSGNQTYGFLDRRFFFIGPDGTRTQLPEFKYGSFDEEASSMNWRLSENDLTKETVGVFSGYRSYFSFVVSDYAEQEGQTDAAKEHGWKRLQQKIDEELKDKNCRH